MKCPDCGTEYECPCDSCSTRKKSDWKRTDMTSDKNDWKEVCPGCGKSESIHWWYDEDGRQYEANKLEEAKK